MNGVIDLSPIEPDEIEKILDQHEGKLEKIDGEINKANEEIAKANKDIDYLKTSCSITEGRLKNIELGQIKNRDLYQESLKGINQAMTTTTDSLLLMNNNVNTLFSNVLTYITERDKGDNKTEVALNTGWNKREIILASITGILSLIGIICGVYKLVV
jgi:Mg2+ and Co2+ transporter CorA